MSKWDQPNQLTAGERAKLEKRKKRQLKSENGRNQKRRIDDNEKSEPTRGNIDVGTSSLPQSAIPTIQRCRSIDNYETLNKIESGTYGVVYRAKELSTHEIVAVKKLKLLEASQGFPITSLREIAALKEMSGHPNIVRIREVVVGEKTSDVYIIMDFVEHDLRTLIQDMREPFLISETKTILLQIASATKAIHDKWLMHRDLKTSNVLMTNNGVVKIADFGLTRKVDNKSALTQTVITLWYRPPEILLGAKEYGCEIDMWAIGCIFAELLYKQPLLQGKSETNQLIEIMTILGPPSEEYWTHCLKAYPAARNIRLPSQQSDIMASLLQHVCSDGANLLHGLLEYDPSKRLTCDDVLSHPFFSKEPLPKPLSMFPSFPSKGGLEHRPSR
ncbi:cyclin-dependent serine/threonine protein kinase CTK1 [Sugiyamaella lignohabitans]|uniref:cyclin-dependent kinase n=1 Tax=Sugiyamaella lignohabitans TaxID=796027 RepID=A0A167DX47_9ASCO|nr:cyclin-dependent serine/threonine protein kinase CTK1 [Sugiyamaella lignohabitans]ANB13400.1 cyclin-dependent serine/threonine protein kinase CTK1 [Sugiyamaella lignohabitans]